MQNNHFEKWQQELVKSFKLEDMSQLQKKFEIYRQDAPAYNALIENTPSYFLESFPKSCEFFRMNGCHSSETHEHGVHRFLSDNPEDDCELIIRDLETQGKGWVDILTVLENVNFDWKRINDSGILSGNEIILDLALIQQAGANPVIELQAMLKLLKSFKENNIEKIHVHFALDSQVFLQVAKLRAARVMIETLQKDVGLGVVKFMCSPSKSYFTQYETSTNMLRNVAACSAAMMGGADIIVLDNYIDAADENFWRQTRNTYHVLNDESALNAVSDPARGSLLMESVTDYLIQTSYQEFKKDLATSLSDFLQRVSIECNKLAKVRQELVETGKLVLVGVNNYANPNDSVEEKLEFHQTDLFPLQKPSVRLESLRSALQDKPLSLGLYSFGELKSVFERINFAQNFFEILGKPVEHTHFNDFELKTGHETAIIICALDEDYEKLKSHIGAIKKPVFIISREVQIDDTHLVYRGVNMIELFKKSLKVVEEVL